MIYDVKTVEEYMNAIPKDRVDVINRLRKVLKMNLPIGFEEEIQYGMIGYVVPLSIYPKGYHCKENTPLPFISIASQKNTINFYHMGVYADGKLFEWFTDEYQKQFHKNLDSGKSCFRFKKHEDIPYNLIGELATKISVQEVINTFENR